MRAADVGYRAATTIEPGASLALRVMADDTWTVSRSTTVALPSEQVHARLAFGWLVGSSRGRVLTEVSVTTGSAALRVDVVREGRVRGRHCTTLTIRPAGVGSELTCSVTGRHTLLSRLVGAFASMDALVGPHVDRALARISTVAAA